MVICYLKRRLVVFKKPFYRLGT